MSPPPTATPTPRPATSPIDEPVRRWVNPYPWRDWALVVGRNLRQRPTDRMGHTAFLPRDAVIDETVVPATSVALLGDVMPVRSRRFALDDDLAAHLATAEHLVVNLEGVLWPGPGPAPKVFAAQRHHDLQVLDVLAAAVPAERTVVTVANNHSADLGLAAHRHTVAVVADRGHPVVGTLKQPTVRVGGTVNVAAVTQWTNQRHSYLPWLDDEARLVDPDAAFQLLVPHWGFEHETHPRASVVARAAELVQRWDAVVGHHPHVPCPVTTLPGPGGRPRLVAYSLGQAASDLRYPIYRYGQVVRLELGPRPDGRWAVGRASWRFLALTQPDDRTVRASLRDTNQWFPEVGGA